MKLFILLKKINGSKLELLFLLRVDLGQKWSFQKCSKLAVTKGKTIAELRMLYLIDQLWPSGSVFLSSVSASISLVRAKVGWYVLVLAKVVRACVLVCACQCRQAHRFAALHNPAHSEREIAYEKRFCIEYKS